MKPTPTGFILPKAFKKYYKKASETNVYLSTLYVLLDHFLLWVPFTIIYLNREEVSLPIFIVLSGFSMIISSRSLRALECFVHEGSHYNHLRKNKVLNDILTNILSSYIVFSTVETYRESHSKHHKYLGSKLDPDYIRHDLLELYGLNRSNKKKYLIHLITRIHKYVPSWWAAIGTNITIFSIAAFWHIIFLLCSMVLLSPKLGISDIILIWSVSFLAPFIFILPILRFIGESNEHDYLEYGEIIVKTFANTGHVNKMIFHPHNDGYHTLHHVLPSIPFYNLSKAHYELIRVEKNGYEDILRERVNTLSNASIITDGK